MQSRIQQGEMIAVAAGTLALNANGNLDGELQMTVTGLERDRAGARHRQDPGGGRAAGDLDRVAPGVKTQDVNNLFGALDKAIPGLGKMVKQNANVGVAARSIRIGRKPLLEGKKARSLPAALSPTARVMFRAGEGRAGAAAVLSAVDAVCASSSASCGRPKSGAAESWPISTMPRRMARVRVKCSNSASPSPRRIARVSFDRSSLKVPSISSTASLLARNTSRHIVGSEAAMRVKSRKPPAENLITSDVVTCAEFVGGADDGVGDQMRQMAGDREHEIMMIRRHDLDLGAERGPERAQLFDRLRHRCPPAA